ncbi:hypothetical protein FVE85_7068 [Porphyridium purpureum]|uniref:Uncharacterized protein n=1 Tax=Porphyridium purpureum TaxID=35688 RepID=A0A5J4Z9Q8_PORPP|nr:hypothetical protein FVE85_7068 [Porphyridium purpureum]|eukprot:POR7264..scf295_1
MASVRTVWVLGLAAALLLSASVEGGAHASQLNPALVQRSASAWAKTLTMNSRAGDFAQSAREVAHFLELVAERNVAHDDAAAPWAHRFVARVGHVVVTHWAKQLCALVRCDDEPRSQWGPDSRTKMSRLKVHDDTAGKKDGYRNGVPYSSAPDIHEHEAHEAHEAREAMTTSDSRRLLLDSQNGSCPLDYVEVMDGTKCSKRPLYCELRWAESRSRTPCSEDVRFRGNFLANDLCIRLNAPDLSPLLLPVSYACATLGVTTDNLQNISDPDRYHFAVETPVGALVSSDSLEELNARLQIKIYNLDLPFSDRRLTFVQSVQAQDIVSGGSLQMKIDASSALEPALVQSFAPGGLLYIEATLNADDGLLAKVNKNCTLRITVELADFEFPRTSESAPFPWWAALLIALGIVLVVSVLAFAWYRVELKKMETGEDPKVRLSWKSKVA